MLTIASEFSFFWSIPLNHFPMPFIHPTVSMLRKQWLIKSSFSDIPVHESLACSLWDLGGETWLETALTSLMKHVSVLFSASCLSHSESKTSRQESPLLECWISFKSQEFCSSLSSFVTVNTQRVFTHRHQQIHLSLDLADMPLCLHKIFSSILTCRWT